MRQCWTVPYGNHCPPVLICLTTSTEHSNRAATAARLILIDLEARRPRSRGQQAWFPLRTGGKNLFSASPLASGGLLAIFGVLRLIYRSIAPTPTFIFTWPPPCRHVCTQIPPFQKDISHIGLGAHPHSTLTSFSLITSVRTLFPNRPRS